MSLFACFPSIWDLGGDHKGTLYKSYRADPIITQIGDTQIWQGLDSSSLTSMCFQRKFTGMLVSTGGPASEQRSQLKVTFFSMVFKSVVSTTDARDSNVISIMHGKWEGINEVQDEDRLYVHIYF